MNNNQRESYRDLVTHLNRTLERETQGDIDKQSLEQIRMNIMRVVDRSSYLGFVEQSLISSIHALPQFVEGQEIHGDDLTEDEALAIQEDALHVMRELVIGELTVLHPERNFEGFSLAQAMHAFVYTRMPSDTFQEVSTYHVSSNIATLQELFRLCRAPELGERVEKHGLHISTSTLRKSIQAVEMFERQLAAPTSMHEVGIPLDAAIAPNGVLEDLSHTSQKSTLDHIRATLGLEQLKISLHSDRFEYLDDATKQQLAEGLLKSDDDILSDVVRGFTKVQKAFEEKQSRTLGAFDTTQFEHHKSHLEPSDLQLVNGLYTNRSDSSLTAFIQATGNSASDHMASIASLDHAGTIALIEGIMVDKGQRDTLLERLCSSKIYNRLKATYDQIDWNNRAELSPLLLSSVQSEQALDLSSPEASHLMTTLDLHGADVKDVWQLIQSIRKVHDRLLLQEYLDESTITSEHVSSLKEVFSTSEGSALEQRVLALQEVVRNQQDAASTALSHQQVLLNDPSTTQEQKQQIVANRESLQATSQELNSIANSLSNPLITASNIHLLEKQHAQRVEPLLQEQLQEQLELGTEALEQDPAQKEGLHDTIATRIDHVLGMTFQNTLEAEAYIQEVFDMLIAYRGSNTRLEGLLDGEKKLRLAPSVWFQLQAENNVSFSKVSRISATTNTIHFEGLKEPVAFNKFVFQVLRSVFKPENASDGMNLHFAYDAASYPMANVSSLERAMGLSEEQDEDQEGASHLEEGVVLYNGNEPMSRIDKIRGTSIKLTGEHAGWYDFEEFYLIHKHGGFGDELQFYAGTSEKASKAQERINNLKDKSRRPGISVMTVIHATKNIFKNLQSDAEKRVKMQRNLMQMNYWKNSTSKIGKSLYGAARSAMLGLEEEKIKSTVDDLKGKDSTSRKHEILKIIGEIKARKDDIHVPYYGSENPYITTYGALVGLSKTPTAELRAKLKAVFIYMVESHGSLYPFKEMEAMGITNGFWLELFAESPAALAKAKLSCLENEGVNDGTLEVNQLQYLFREQNHLWGQEMASKLDDAWGAGAASNEKTIEGRLAKATSTDAIRDIIVKNIDNGRFKGIDVAINKFIMKGGKPEEVFDIMLYMYQSMYMPASEHGMNKHDQSRISMGELQTIGKKVLGQFPYFPFAAFTNINSFRDFHLILQNKELVEEHGTYPYHFSSIAKLNEGRKTNGKGTKGLWKKLMLEEDYYLLKFYDKKDTPEHRYLMNCFKTARENTMQGHWALNVKDHKAVVWKVSTLMTANERTFESFVLRYLSASSTAFENDNAKEYFDSVLNAFEQLDRSPEVDISVKNKLRNDIRKDLYNGFYSKMNLSERMVNKEYGATERLRFAPVKHDNSRDAFFRVYNDRLLRLGLDVQTCFEAVEPNPYHKYTYQHRDQTRPYVPMDMGDKIRRASNGESYTFEELGFEGNPILKDQELQLNMRTSTLSSNTSSSEQYLPTGV